mgnify:CR=1 FL=1
MNIALVAVGTRGDVQPFLALALGLQKAGFSPFIVSAKNEEAFVRSFGVAFHALNVDIQKIMDDQAAQAMAHGDNPLSFAKSHLEGSKVMAEIMLQAQEEIWLAVQNAHAIVYHPGMQNCLLMAQEIGIPAIMASPFPFANTSNYPAILFYDKIRIGGVLGNVLNRSTHMIFEQMFWMLSRGAAKAFWSKQGKPHIPKITPPIHSQAAKAFPQLFAYSPIIFPPDTAWQENLAVTGYWTLPENDDFTPSDELIRFLDKGESPIYIGFGSIKSKGAFQETLTQIVEAVERVGVRALVGLGWSSVEGDIKLPENVSLIGSAPHQWLFPRMSAVVHHGGAGTTAAGLIAGKATLIIPHTGDQPAWGKRVWEMGVGAKPIPKKHLSADTLEAGLREVLQPHVRANAKRLGEKLSNETGVDNAVAVIRQCLQSSRTD